MTRIRSDDPGIIHSFILDTLTADVLPLSHFDTTRDYTALHHPTLRYAIHDTIVHRSGIAAFWYQKRPPLSASLSTSRRRLDSR